MRLSASALKETNMTKFMMQHPRMTFGIAVLLALVSVGLAPASNTPALALGSLLALPMAAIASRGPEQEELGF